QLQRSVHNFVPCGILICHHCLAFCDCFLKELLNGFHTAVHSAAFHICLGFVQEIFQRLFADCLVSRRRLCFRDLPRKIICRCQGALCLAVRQHSLRFIRRHCCACVGCL